MCFRGGVVTAAAARKGSQEACSQETKNCKEV